jgi:hypothetical protein
MTLTDRFLRAKHWQLFLLMFGIPMIFQFIVMGTAFASIITKSPPDETTFMNFFYLFPILMVIFAGTFFGWFWSIGTGLQSKIPTNVKMKTGKFKVFFFVPLVYTLLIFIAMGTALSGIFGSGEPNAGLIFTSIAIIIPLHLFNMFCMFYCLYFVSKTFKTVELQRETTFSDFAGEFFLLWFYPIGIWIVQPKINKMVDEKLNVAS